jgi:hypothetical protein
MLWEMESMRTKVVLALIAIGLVLASAAVVVTLRLYPRKPAPDAVERIPVPAFLIEDNKDPMMGESEVEGHRDLRFENSSEKPVSVRLEATDCECAYVQIYLAPQEWKALDLQEIHKRAADPSLPWQSVAPLGAAITVPPQSVGLFRLTWKTNVVGTRIFWADFLLDDGEDRGRRRVEVPVNLVEIVRLRPEDRGNEKEFDLDSLKPGEERTARFVCYSVTRDRFALTPSPVAEDSCINYGPPHALSRAELQGLSDKIGSPVKSGYRVSVTVREHAGERRLDIGPFHRRVAWKTDVIPDHRVTTFLNGTVRGEVSLAAPEDKPFVDLGTILPTEKWSEVFTLQSPDPRIQLSVDEERTLAFLRVELLDGRGGETTRDGKSWRVRLTFRSDSLFRGPFPHVDRPGFDSAVVCSIVFRIKRAGKESNVADQSARRVLIPVRGNVRAY